MMSSPVPSAPSPIDPEGGPAEVPATGGQEESCAQQHDLGSDVALNAPETVQLQAQQAPDAAAGPSNGGMINPAAPRPSNMPTPPASKPNREMKVELKVEDALHYLDQVKMEFHDKPHIYNEFLEIMKNFKSQSINTPGVIARVKSLFRGYNKLILGFNAFLPEGEGYKIELTPEAEAMEQEQLQLQQQQQQQAQMAMMGGGPAPDNMVPMDGGAHAAAGMPMPMAVGMPMGYAGAPPSQVAGGVPMMGMMQPGGAPGMGGAMPPPGMGGLAPGMPVPGALGGAPAPAAVAPSASPAQGNKAGPPQFMHQQHAIQYVTTIRNRFANEPEVYRQFRKILDTYQREPKGIKEVLEQVSHLFADHPDLLMEFTHFLPYAVQDQAKERLNRAVKEEEHRRTLLLQQQQQQGLLPDSLGGKGAAKRQRDAMGGANRNVKARADAVQAIVNRGMTPDMGGAAMMMRGHPGNMMGGAMMGQMGSGAMRGSGGTHMGMGQQGYGNARGNEPSMSMKQVGAKVANNARRRTGGQMDIQPGMSREAMQAAANAQAINRVHTVSAERRFFDQVKDILSSTSRDSWTEFVKCLELFSNDYISKKDMFKLVQDLFGPTNTNLFEEFKALLFRRSAYDSSASDMWYAIPLSEIDFSQCLKCTPSYRALPKDYPKAVCSDRDAMEQSVLNDAWVSIPIGSEESYSFKHMRKNQYEEALFKCEDDRFEIDMLIDTNLSTIRMLEPLCEEIQHIKQLEESETGGPKFNFQLEKRHLSPIHINCISRIYGEYSGEILELLRKNPVGAVPVVLKRLKQKDLEWRKARQDMNKMWREVLATNSERSFDHRSFYHRVQDKRSYNARHLVADIKTIGCNPEAITPPELVPLGVVCPVPASHPMLSLCGPDVLPCHLLMTFENEGRGVHRDIFRIFCHAAELSGMNNVDKERISALWRDLIRVFFDFPVHFMYNASQGVSTESAHPHYAPSNVKGVAPDVAPSWPIGTSVLTFYGVGTVTGFRAEDSMHSVRLPFGIAYMRPSCILGSEELSNAAMAAIGVSKDANGRDVILNGLSTNIPKGEPLVKQPQQLFFGTQMCYVFMRLYHTIYSRLLSAKRLARANAEAESAKEAGSLNVPLHKYDEPEEDPIASSHSKGAGRQNVSNRADAYSCLLSQVMAVVDGTIDASKFEDNCRQLLGNKSFFLYTIDKILQQALKCLQAMANDEIITKLVGIFLYHRSRNIKSGTLPSLYRKHVAHCLSNTLEEVYRLQYITTAAGETRGNSAVVCQLLGTLSFDEEAEGTYSAADVSTPRPSQTPRAMGSAGSDSLTNSTIKAPQLVLPDAEEDEDEEDEEEEDGDSENNAEDALDDTRRIGNSVAMDIAVANDGEEEGEENEDEDGMENEDEDQNLENDDEDEGSDGGEEEEEGGAGRRGGNQRRGAAGRGRGASGRGNARGGRGANDSNGADKGVSYMQMLPTGFNSQADDKAAGAATGRRGGNLSQDSSNRRRK